MSDEFNLIERDENGHPQVRYCLDPREVTVIRDPQAGDAIIGYVWEPVGDVGLSRAPQAVRDIVTDLPDGILYMPDPQKTHVCRPPEITTFDHDNRTEEGVPVIKRQLGEGTIWQCKCGRVKIVYWVPPQDYGYTRLVGHRGWRDEKRRERRRRLGLRWWQKEAR